MDSAVTQIDAAASSALIPERQITFDQPFHYQIILGETGMQLFTGWVADPR